VLIRKGTKPCVSQPAWLGGKRPFSLPEALKEYVEGQVASGDRGTPSEYVRELIRRDKEGRLGNLQEDLLAAVRGAKIELPIAEIRKRGLVQVLRQRMRRK
jgi:antitoxin ParD1/3/4